MSLINERIKICGLTLERNTTYTFRSVIEQLGMDVSAELLNRKVRTESGQISRYGDLPLICPPITDLPEEYERLHKDLRAFMWAVSGMVDGSPHLKTLKSDRLSYHMATGFGRIDLYLNRSREWLRSDPFVMSNGQTCLEVLEKLMKALEDYSRTVIEEEWSLLFDADPSFFDGDPYAFAMLSNTPMNNGAIYAFDAKVPALTIITGAKVFSKGKAFKAHIGLWALPKAVYETWKEALGKNAEASDRNYVAPVAGLRCDFLEKIPEGVNLLALAETAATFLKDSQLDEIEACRAALALES